MKMVDLLTLPLYPHVSKPDRLEGCFKCQPQVAYLAAVFLLKSLFFEVRNIHYTEKFTVLGLSGKNC